MHAEKQIKSQLINVIFVALNLYDYKNEPVGMSKLFTFNVYDLLLLINLKKKMSMMLQVNTFKQPFAKP